MLWLFAWIGTQDMNPTQALQLSTDHVHSSLMSGWCSLAQSTSLFHKSYDTPNITACLQEQWCSFHLPQQNSRPSWPWHGH